MDLQRLPNGRPARNRAVGTMRVRVGRQKKRAPGLILHDEDELCRLRPMRTASDVIDGGPNRGDIANPRHVGKGP